MKELNQIQTELHAPKNLTNEFGRYKYRSLENILTAVKPLLKKTECTITFSDDLILVGERYYVKSTCELCGKSGEKICATAFAREQETKKGMDEAQITGSASSYARKYAICSLLGIDDNKEPDMLNNNEESEKPMKNVPTLEHVVAKAEAATSIDELKSVWNAYKSTYGKDNSFKRAIAVNPNNIKAKAKNETK